MVTDLVRVLLHRFTPPKNTEWLSIGNATDVHHPTHLFDKSSYLAYSVAKLHIVKYLARTRNSVVLKALGNICYITLPSEKDSGHLTKYGLYSAKYRTSL